MFWRFFHVIHINSLRSANGNCYSFYVRYDTVTCSNIQHYLPQGRFSRPVARLVGTGNDSAKNNLQSNNTPNPPTPYWFPGIPDELFQTVICRHCCEKVFPQLKVDVLRHWSGEGQCGKKSKSHVAMQWSFLLRTTFGVDKSGCSCLLCGLSVVCMPKTVMGGVPCASHESDKDYQLVFVIFFPVSMQYNVSPYFKSLFTMQRWTEREYERVERIWKENCMLMANFTATWHSS